MTLVPVFSPGELIYTVSVPYRMAETTVRPALADPDETYIINLGGVQQSENAPAVVELSAGVNNITVVVTSADTSNPTTQTYTVAVTRAVPSTDATLSALVLGGTSSDEWTPIFAPDVYDYDVPPVHKMLLCGRIRNSAWIVRMLLLAVVRFDLSLR